MSSSVAIDDELRRKLKILAAKYDTTQAEIIKKALELFEGQEMNRQKNISPKVEKMLKEANTSVLSQNTRRKKIITALNKPGIDIDELRIKFNEY